VQHTNPNKTKQKRKRKKNKKQKTKNKTTHKKQNKNKTKKRTILRFTSLRTVLISSTVRHAERERKGEGKRGLAEGNDVGSPESTGHNKS
jgi:hypothetical protein